MALSWWMLIVAGLFEVCWAVGLKYTQGFTKPVASAVVVAFIVVSMVLLARAAQQIPIGTAYAVWVGIGAFGAAVLGIVLFAESASPLRLLFLALLVASIVGLKLTSGGS